MTKRLNLKITYICTFINNKLSMNEKWKIVKDIKLKDNLSGHYWRQAGLIDWWMWPDSAPSTQAGISTIMMLVDVCHICCFLWHFSQKTTFWRFHSQQGGEVRQSGPLQHVAAPGAEGGLQEVRWVLRQLASSPISTFPPQGGRRQTLWRRQWRLETRDQTLRLTSTRLSTGPWPAREAQGDK